MTCNLIVQHCQCVIFSFYRLQYSLYKKSLGRHDSQPLSVNSGPPEVCLDYKLVFVTMSFNTYSNKIILLHMEGGFVWLIEFCYHSYLFSWQVVHCISSTDFDQKQVLGSERFAYDNF